MRRQRPPLDQRAGDAGQQRPARYADAGGVLELCCHEMPLIEGGWRPLRIEIQPVLRDAAAALRPAALHAAAQAERRIVHGLRQAVLHRSRETVAQTPANMQLSCRPDGSPVGCDVDEACRTGRAWIQRTGRICVRQELLNQVAAFRAEVGGKNRQRRR